MPDPPEGGLILRGSCCYLSEDGDGQLARAKVRYYDHNPDAWAVETQSDFLWLTKGEVGRLILDSPKVGTRVPLDAEIGRRLLTTVGIDYMEGSVNALPVRESKLEVVIAEFDAENDRYSLRLEGSAELGEAFTKNAMKEARSRGSRIELKGHIEFRKGAVTRFDVVGVGEAWGCKMSYTKRAMSVTDHPWKYGVALELVTTREPIDLIPPYNLLHYGGGMKYFGEGG